MLLKNRPSKGPLLLKTDSPKDEEALKDEQIKRLKQKVGGAGLEAWTS
jgi:hypothetical protein